MTRQQALARRPVSACLAAAAHTPTQVGDGKPPIGKPRRTRWFIGTAGVTLMCLGGLYVVLFLLNLVWPTPLEFCIPRFLHPSLFRIHLIGKRQKEYYDNGRLRCIKAYLPQHGDWYYGSMYDPYGTWVSKSPDGSCEIRMRYPDGTGVWAEWYPNGILNLLGRFRTGKREGLWITWHKNGVKGWEEEFHAGLPEGMQRYWRKDGTLVEESHCKAGVVHGVLRHWYSNGRLSYEKQFRHGEPYGKWTSYKWDGTVSATLVWPNATGIWNGWFEDGPMMFEERYEDGRMHGLRRSWSTNGLLDSERVYDRGRELYAETKHYDPGGELLP